MGGRKIYTPVFIRNKDFSISAFRTGSHQTIIPMKCFIISCLKAQEERVLAEINPKPVFLIRIRIPDPFQETWIRIRVAKKNCD